MSVRPGPRILLIGSPGRAMIRFRDPTSAYRHIPGDGGAAPETNAAHAPSHSPTGFDIRSLGISKQSTSARPQDVGLRRQVLLPNLREDQPIHDHDLAH